MFVRARNLRKEMTDAEKKLWKYLRGKKLEGYKFRRQHPVKQFILDFYCSQCKLAIEIDGGIHQNPEIKEHDKNRTAEIENMGIHLIRFTNQEVFEQINDVLQTILRELKEN